MNSSSAHQAFLPPKVFPPLISTTYRVDLHRRLAARASHVPSPWSCSRVVPPPRTTDTAGASQTLVSSSRSRLSPTQRATLRPEEIEVSGAAGVHAEQKIMDHANANGMTVQTSAPSRPACLACSTNAGTQNIQLQNPQQQ